MRCTSRWDAGGSPSQAMDLKEMGVDGHVSRETGESTADRIFFMKYPLPFLQHWYTTYPPPQQDTTTTGSSVVSPSSADVDVDMTGDSTSTLTDSNFPHIPPILITSWTSTMRCSVGRIIQTKQTFSTVPTTRTQMRELDLEEVGC